MSPRRIQMTRQRPWRPEHPDAVIVARPSKWGNPARIERISGRPGMPRMWGVWASDVGPLIGTFHDLVAARAAAATYFRQWVTGPDGHIVDDSTLLARQSLANVAAYEAIHEGEGISALAGRDLACWCPLDQPCHADVLLKLANGDAP